MKLRLEPIVYALVWSSKHVGDVPGDSIVRASFNREDLEGGEIDDTYDGVSMRTEGSVKIREYGRPKMIETLLAKGARIDVCGNEYEVGCWFDDKPYGKFFDSDRGMWSWPNAAVHWYLEACRVASNFPHMGA